MATKKDDATSNLLDALVAHATRHGGDTTELLDAQAKYHGEPTAAERTKEAQDADDAEQEAGKAANAEQVRKAKEADDA